MGNFVNWWQHLPEHTSPILFSIGSFQLRYYGLMYIVAFALTFVLMNYRIKDEKLSYKKDHIENYFYWVIIAVLLGGRLGYVVFYNFSYFLSNPLEIFLPFDIKNNFKFTGIAGMSYHGATIGAIIGTYLFCRKYKYRFRSFTDLVAPAVPLGYTFGRLGNFLNGELYGRVTDSSIGMYFPGSGDGLLRHPSQLYEGFFEGIVLFLILWFLRKKKLGEGAFLGLYIVGYGLFRYLIEFFREPDSQLGFVLSFMSMGQVLCMFMIAAGIAIVLYCHYVPAGKKV